MFILITDTRKRSSESLSDVYGCLWDVAYEPRSKPEMIVCIYVHPVLWKLIGWVCYNMCSLMITIEFFEELALESAPSRPSLWKRYVDDTCCILKISDVDGLLDHLNGIRPTIKFTMELEREGSLPFLDTKVTRLADGKLDITVYRKKTHTDRYLHFDSHHPCLLYTSPSPRDATLSRMPSSA